MQAEARFGITPSVQPPIGVRAEAQARGWTLTGSTWTSAAGVTYWLTGCNRKIGFNTAQRRFMVIDRNGCLEPW